MMRVAAVAGDEAGGMATRRGRAFAQRLCSLRIAMKAASGAAIRNGILWKLVTTCLFVCQDSTSRVLFKSYPATEIAFARFFVHMGLVTFVIASRAPSLMISRRPLLQILRPRLEKPSF
jgi:hypothetical protein